MGKEKISLQKSIQNRFDSMLRIGASKRSDKIAGNDTKKYIYSWESYRSYLKHATYFSKWVKEQPVDAALGHKPRTPEEARPFVEKWLCNSIERGLSAYTIKLQAAAMAKLYGCSIKDFEVKTPGRNRADIKRSRGERVRDKNFNEERHKDLVTFCRCTGVRRAELGQLRGSDLIEKDGKYYFNITRATKGGRPRTSPVMSASDEELQLVIELAKKAGSGKIFEKVSTNADIHGYRAEYATRVYNAFKRDLSEISNERLIIYQNHVIDAYTAPNCHVVDRERYAAYYSSTKKDRNGKPAMKTGYRDVSAVYHCQRDLAGVHYDRRALFIASEALGHSRESVVAEHYLR